MAAQAIEARASLLTLPRELQGLIFEHISYIDTIRLSQVNRYLHQSVNPLANPQEDKEQCLLEAEKWDQHNRGVYGKREGNWLRSIKLLSNGYACFRCYKIKDKAAFARNQTERRGAKHSNSYKHKGRKRCCIECGLNLGLYRPGTVMNIISATTLLAEPYEDCHGGSSVSARSRMHATPVWLCEGCDEVRESVLTCLNRECEECNYVEPFQASNKDCMRIMLRRIDGVFRIQCKGCDMTKTIRNMAQPMLYNCCGGCSFTIDKHVEEKQAHVKLPPEEKFDVFERDETDLPDNLHLHGGSWTFIAQALLIIFWNGDKSRHWDNCLRLSEHATRKACFSDAVCNSD